MTYKEAEDLAAVYSGVIGKPLLNKCYALDDRKITSLLICSIKNLREVYSLWWHNGHDNQKAIESAKKDKNLEVFLISYNPNVERVIYYLRLSKYVELGEK